MSDDLPAVIRVEVDSTGFTRGMAEAQAQLNDFAALAARRRRRQHLKAIWRGIRAQAQRVVLVVALAAYWVAALAPYQLGAPRTAALAGAATLLCVAFIVLLGLPQTRLEQRLAARGAAIVDSIGRALATVAARLRDEARGLWHVMRCAARRRHNPVRHPLGGFRCSDCGAAGADLEAMGFDSGYVRPR